VLLNAYIHWGISFLDRLDGMFAFAIYDKAKNHLLIARDRIGEKPLSIYEDEDKWVISSEMRSIRKLPNTRFSIDRNSMEHYFTFGYCYPQNSSYSQVKKLHPGHYAIISDGEMSIQRYHSISNFSLLSNENEVIELVNQGIERAVEAQMVADVPVGVFFSGGIDSSILLAKMAKHNPDLLSYTIGLKNNPEDESRHAKTVANYLGVTNKTYWYTENDLLHSHQKICSSFDDFFSNASAFALHLLSEIAVKDVKVVLCGDGGDELFGGYSRYAKAEKFKKIALINQLLPSKSGKSLKLKNKYFRNLGSDSFTSIYQRTFEIMQPTEVRSLLQDTNENEFSFPYFKEYSNEYRSNNGTDILNEMAYIDIYSRLSESFLTKTDRMTMASSLESRVPLLSRELIELGLRIDGKIKMKNGQSKYILRKVLEKHLPTEMVNRKKQGFYVPVEDYFATNFLSYAQEILTDDFIKMNPILNSREVNRIIAEVKKGNRRYARHLWHILNFETWRLVNQIKG
ncbi:MAG: asparagine synthase (glutamine-hydrolyzing), partial [Bacteroidia bacterium]|nr:asparagine synthase (glutamine-hydrolyzing) [Bacteroidia bacterium]